MRCGARWEPMKNKADAAAGTGETRRAGGFPLGAGIPNLVMAMVAARPTAWLLGCRPREVLGGRRGPGRPLPLIAADWPSMGWRSMLGRRMTGMARIVPRFWSGGKPPDSHGAAGAAPILHPMDLGPALPPLQFQTRRLAAQYSQGSRSIS